MDLSDAINTRLPPGLGLALRALGALAASRREGLYLVGGAVRDLLLGRAVAIHEVDLVLVGDVSRLAREAEARGLARRTARSQFLTLKLEVAGHGGVDLVTARRESYAHPGALPAVEPAGLEEDLRRRDFSINAMALFLGPAEFAAVMDPCDGLRDLRLELLRALHPASFRDDATRILRAARYATRFGFHLAQDTEVWLRRDAPYLGTITADRLRHEMDRLWQEEAPEAALGWLQAHGALAHLHPSLRWDPELARAFAQGRAARPPDVPLPSLYLALLACRAEPAASEALTGRLNLPPHQALAVRDAARLGPTLPQGRTPQDPPSVCAEQMDGHHPAAVLAWSLLAPPHAAGLLHRYLTEWRHVRPGLTGEDLIALGVPRGPAVGLYLTRLRRARLDGLAADVAGERALAASWLSAAQGPA